MTVRTIAIVLIVISALSGCRAPATSTTGRKDTAPPGLTVEETTFAAALGHYSSGRILYDTEPLSEKALAEFEKSIKFDPDQVRIPLSLAVSYCRRNRPEDAIRVLSTACTRHPQNYKLCALLAYVYHISGDHAHAIEEYKRLTTIAPAKSAGYVGLANVYLLEQKEEMACMWLRRALGRINDTNNLGVVCRSFAHQYIVAGQSSPAIECLKLISEIEPRAVSPVISLFFHQLLAGRNEQARESIRKALDKVEDPQAVIDSCNYLAARLIEFSRFEEAVQCLETVLEHEPDDLSAVLRLSGYYLTIRKRDRAEEILNGVSEEYKTNPHFCSAVAKLFAATGVYDEAIKAFEKVERTLAQSGEQDNTVRDAFYYYWYGAACEREGRLEKAAKFLQKTIDLEPENANAYNYLAYMWAEQNTNLDKALDYVLKALQHEPTNAAYIDTLGWIYYRQKKYDMALKQIQKAHSLMPKDATLADHLGDVFAARGQCDEAVWYWTRSFLLDSLNDEVAEKLKAHGREPALLRGRTSETGE